VCVEWGGGRTGQSSIVGSGEGRRRGRRRRGPAGGGSGELPGEGVSLEKRAWVQREPIQSKPCVCSSRCPTLHLPLPRPPKAALAHVPAFGNPPPPLVPQQPPSPRKDAPSVQAGWRIAGRTEPVGRCRGSRHAAVLDECTCMRACRGGGSRCPRPRTVKRRSALKLHPPRSSRSSGDQDRS
jgi:hypothetical protein